MELGSVVVMLTEFAALDTVTQPRVSSLHRNCGIFWQLHAMENA
jgi:hypothetical protein